MKLAPKSILFLVVAGCLAAGAWSGQGLASYTNSQFSTLAGNDVKATLGQDGVYAGRITLPAAAEDAQIVNGATATIVAGNPLSAFASTNKFFDIDEDALFNSGEGIVEGVISSSDDILDAGDTIVSAPGSWTFGEFGSVESGQSMYGFIDADNDGVLDLGEDVVRQVFNGPAETLTSGDQVKPLAASMAGGLFYFTSQAAGDEYDWDYSGAFIKKTEENDFGFIGTGKFNYKNYTPADHICGSDRDSSGGFSFPDAIWADVNGSGCAAFQSGTDVVLWANGTALSGPNYDITGEEVGASFGYIDANHDGVSNCSRATCEAFVAILADVADDATANPANTYLLPPESVLADGIENTGISFRDDPEGVLGAVNASTAITANGDHLFGYIDTNSNGGYIEEVAAGEDLVMLVGSGNTDVLSDGDVFRTLGASDKFLDYNHDGHFDTTDGDVLVRSADDDLDIGALNGSGTDRILTVSTVDNLSSFPDNIKYHDHDSSGTYADGDDIVRDEDLSGYYNAEDIQTVAVEAAGTRAITDSDLDGLYIYGRSNNDCEGGEGSVLLGSDTSAPMLNQAITLTKAPYAVGETVVLCIVADIKSSATPGKVFNPRFGTNDLVFSSGSSPSDSAVTLATDSTAVNIISDALDATITPTSLVKSVSTTYTAAFTLGTAIADGGGVTVTFPAGYSVAGATMTCTENGGAVTGTSGVSGQAVTLTLTGDSLAGGSDVSCAIAGVTNPETTGETGTFRVASRASVSADLEAEVDALDTITITAAARGGGGGSSAPVRTEGLSVVSPALSTEWLAKMWHLVEWRNTGSFVSPYVNISITDAQGVKTVLATRVPNASVQSVYLPSLPSGLATLTVEGTDLLSIGATSSVQIKIVNDSVIALPSEPGQSPEIADYCEMDGAALLSAYVKPTLAGRLLKTPASSTVFYQMKNGQLRPFFTEPTFLAWGANFGQVATVSVQSLSNSSFGAPMPPAPGSVLVKTASSSKVYALEPNTDEPAKPTFHWVTSELAARTYFGDNWNQRIVDVSEALIQGAEMGDLITEECRPWYTRLY